MGEGLLAASVTIGLGVTGELMDAEAGYRRAQSRRKALRSATSPSHTGPACDTSPLAWPVTKRGRYSLVACPTEDLPNSA